MIKGLIGSIGKISRDAAIMCIGIYTIVWALGELREVFNPMAFNQALEAKILQSEGRSKEYADEKSKHIEQLLGAHLTAVKGEISGLKTSVDGLRTDLKEIYKDKGVAGLPDFRGGVN